jgi:hypothetical protein
MKKFTILAVAALTAFGWAGCARENSVTETREVGLTVRLDGGTMMRSIEDAGAGEKAIVGLPEDGFYGFIYVISAAGVATPYELVVGEASSSAGQFLGEVNLNSWVYVVANVPAAQKDRFAMLSTLEDIKAATTAITTQKDYMTVALANKNAEEEPVVDPDGDGEALAEVVLTPLISRLELTAVRAKPLNSDVITSFRVAAVYVDKFYRDFRWDGQGVNVYQMGTMPDYAQVVDFGMGDEKVFSSTPEPTGSTCAVMNMDGAGHVWAYNVPAGGLPMLIVKVEDVRVNGDENFETTLVDGSTVKVSQQKFYLTVTGYTHMATTTFERGFIYNVDAIEFDVDDLKYTYPNPSDVELTVKISVDPWQLKSIGAVI